jgi:hypothetical protein
MRRVERAQNAARQLAPRSVGKHAIGYIRVLSVGGRSRPDYHTLDIQRASIERTARSNGYGLVDVHTDQDQSGRSRNRPQFGIAMDRILAGDADAIIVWNDSRLSRNRREADDDVKRLQDHDTDLLSDERCSGPGETIGGSVLKHATDPGVDPGGERRRRGG